MLQNELGTLSEKREIEIMFILYKNKSGLHVGEFRNHLSGDNTMYIQQIIDDLLEYGYISQIELNDDKSPYMFAYVLTDTGIQTVIHNSISIALKSRLNQNTD